MNHVLQNNETTVCASFSEGSHFSLHSTSFKYFHFNKVSCHFDQCKKDNKLQRGVQTPEEKRNLNELKESIS